MTNGEERTQGKRPGTMSRLKKKKCTIIEQLFFLQKNLQYLQKNHLAAAHNVDELGLSLKR